MQLDSDQVATGAPSVVSTFIILDFGVFGPWCSLPTAGSSPSQLLYGMPHTQDQAPRWPGLEALSRQLVRKLIPTFPLEMDLGSMGHAWKP